MIIFQAFFARNAPAVRCAETVQIAAFQIVHSYYGVVFEKTGSLRVFFDVKFI